MAKEKSKAEKSPTKIHPIQPPAETRREALNRLFQENGLVEEDVYKDKTRKYVIMTRTGIDKIIARRKIQIQFEPVLIQLGDTDKKNHVVVRASGQLNDRVCQTFGEASDDNLTAFNQGYPIAMAEKRAKSRCVLQLTGFYQEGVFGDEEEENYWK